MYNDICQEQICKKEKINVLKDTFIAIYDWENWENGKYVNAMQNMREHAYFVFKVSISSFTTYFLF